MLIKIIIRIIRIIMIMMILIIPMLDFHSSLRTLERAPSRVSLPDNSSRLSGFLKWVPVKPDSLRKL